MTPTPGRLTPAGGLTLRRLGPSVYLPSAVYSTGIGAIAPVVVLSATDLGASLATAAVVAGMVGLGAGAMHFAGLAGAYLVAIAAVTAATALLALLPPVPYDRPAHAPGRSPVSLWTVIHGNARTLRTLGLGILLVGALRASRQAIAAAGLLAAVLLHRWIPTPTP